MSDEVSILIADSHPLVRIGVRNLLGADERIKVVGEVEDGDEAITETLDLLPDIVLLDLTMPRLPGLEAMRAIMSGWPKIKILLLNRTIRAQHIIEALQIGARGIVLHEGLDESLEPAIRCVSDGGYWLGQERVEGLVNSLHQLVHEQASPEQKSYGLTRREVEVLRCIVDGCTNRDVATQFGLSEETVKRHLSNIFDKVGVSTRLELALFALANHLVSP
ncbi:two component transcriptional regulator, LuxR family [Acidisarcina polymorpha]|uniref:Two component transcriptional regulator, LuxR family n=1 Tax=Acidisarcina polymorpha TaxID=2211140 RepID=A0A2Z5FUG9_9BACT|nr:response regulator transcription factor [Acidisarcina polymorpha]AXC10501.1 two component transcriptional regulator, LuxR family [Acidisarcina polymorpha]